MKNKLFFLLLITLFSACAEKELPVTTCPLVACTDVFGLITVKMVHQDNSLAIVSGYHILDLRTNTIIKTEALPLSAATYDVADDSDLKLFSTAGDTLLVTFNDSIGTPTRTVPFVIAGGCNCHVFKVSGPDTIRVN